MSDHRHPALGACVNNIDRSFFAELPSRLNLVLVAFKKAIEHRHDGFEGIALSEVGEADVLIHRSIRLGTCVHPTTPG